MSDLENIYYYIFRRIKCSHFLAIDLISQIEFLRACFRDFSLTPVIGIGEPWKKWARDQPKITLQDFFEFQAKILYNKIRKIKNIRGLASLTKIWHFSTFFVKAVSLVNCSDVRKNPKDLKRPKCSRDFELKTQKRTEAIFFWFGSHPSLSYIM